MLQMLFKLILLDSIIVLLCLLIGDMKWLINSQVGFFSSVLVMLASMQSYKQMVKKGLFHGVIPDDGRDTLSKVEDPYELYEEDRMEDENKTLVDVVKEERDKLKKNGRSFWQATKDSKASFSFYRLGAYAVLVLGFFYLNNNNLLDISTYLISLTLGMLAIVFVINI